MSARRKAAHCSFRPCASLAAVDARPDPIVEEVRKVREAHAAEFNYDLRAIYRDLKEKERRSNWKMVSLPPKRPLPVPQSR